MRPTTLSPYLTFNGEARQAMEFYHKVLGGDLKLQTFAEAPGMPAPPPELADKIIHGMLEADGIVIMASEPEPGKKSTRGDNVTLCLAGSDSARLTKAFNGLSEGGKVHMPLAKQFWGDTFGQFTDKFGIQWMVNITDK
jgi:PhnB protein